MTYQIGQRKGFPPSLIRLHQLLQSISKSRNSYLKDRFYRLYKLYFFLKKKVKIEHFLFRLTGHNSWHQRGYLNSLQKVLKFLQIKDNSPIPTHYPLEMLID